MHVPLETPRSVAVSSRTPAPLIPVSADDFARVKRRMVFRWLAAGILVILAGLWISHRAKSSLDARRALRDGKELLKAGRYVESIEAFDRALAAQSGLVDAYLLRGRANAALYRTDASLRDF